jgi:hypothetical protein
MFNDAQTSHLWHHRRKAGIGKNAIGTHQNSPWPTSFSCIYNRGEQKECIVEKSLFFRHALLPLGWAENVMVHILAGHIVRIETAVEANGPAHGIALAGMRDPG